MFDFSQPFSRRRFLAGTSCFGAFYALARQIPLPVLAADVADDARVSKTTLVDKGFASVRKIGNGLYATISDMSNGMTTVCNGGFLVRRDAGVQLAKTNVLTGPNRPLDPAKLPMKVELGGLTAVIESYPGHSGTDMVVRVPEQNVVYTGDLLVDTMYPACSDEKTTVSGWRATLKTFASWDKDTLFVPGHVQLCGQRGIAMLRAIFDAIAEQARTMSKAGVPAQEAQHRYVVPKKFKDFFVFSWEFTIGSTITQLYAEWREEK